MTSACVDVGEQTTTPCNNDEVAVLVAFSIASDSEEYGTVCIIVII